jgi:hypothetical protein
MRAKGTASKRQLPIRGFMLLKAVLKFSTEAENASPKEIGEEDMELPRKVNSLRLQQTALSYQIA